MSSILLQTVTLLGECILRWS